MELRFFVAICYYFLSGGAFTIWGKFPYYISVAQAAKAKIIFYRRYTMAQFTNQARLSYSNGVVNSNVVLGEILEVVSAAKTAIMDDYTRNDDITYVISGLNSGNTAVTGVSITDDLGSYAFGDQTLTPTSYVDGSVHLYINGTLVTAPTVAVAENSVTFSGITIPASSNFILIYETQVNSFAPLAVDSSIVNTANVSGNGIPTPIVVSETVVPEQAPELTLTKSVDPIPVTENGTLTYTFVIQNYGNTAAVATDEVIVSDTFDPILSGLTVTFNGTAWMEGVEYTYNDLTGEFATVASQITVPAATYTQDAVTGEWIITPGVSTLVVSGTV